MTAMDPAGPSMKGPMPGEEGALRFSRPVEPMLAQAAEAIPPAGVPAAGVAHEPVERRDLLSRPWGSAG